jgi:2-dehydro-3-deoxyphosphogluconate aldolase/(4S)-4-hydroxy-2-oxoglutarate aldolase
MAEIRFDVNDFKGGVIMNGILKEISLIGIFPVITIGNAKDAVPVADALAAGGIPCAEITFRTPAAGDAMRAIAKERPEMLVGAGTVLTKKQVDEAIDAGADFIVTLGFNPEIIKYCIEKGITVIPGVNSPSGVEEALAMGLDTVKLFPARESGGPEFIKAISAPYQMVKFIPTGGIDAETFADYLKIPSVIAAGGSWIAPQQLVAEGRFDEITRLAKEAVDRMLNIRLLHVGVNCGSGEVMRKSAEMLDRFLSFPQDVRGDAAIFSGGCLELLSTIGRGKNGHIALATSSPDRAVYHLERRGAKFDMNSAGYDADGSLKVIYFRDEIAGFAYHLLKV